MNFLFGFCVGVIVCFVGMAIYVITGNSHKDEDEGDY